MRCAGATGGVAAAAPAPAGRRIVSLRCGGGAAAPGRAWNGYGAARAPGRGPGGAFGAVSSTRLAFPRVVAPPSAGRFFKSNAACAAAAAAASASTVRV